MRNALRMIAVLVLPSLICPPAGPQAGCTAYSTWGMSGAAGNDPGAPGGDPNWQARIAQQPSLDGGIGPTCNYTWFEQGGGHWYGECQSIAYTCPAPPLPR